MKITFKNSKIKIIEINEKNKSDFLGKNDIKKLESVFEDKKDLYIIKIEEKIFTRNDMNDSMNFEHFISEETKNNYLNDMDIPKSFSELVEIIKPILINPTRLSILIARNTLSDEDYKAMLLKRSQINEYILNKNISITHRQLDS